MLPVKTAAFARPEEATRPAAMLLVYGFTSTSVKRQSGRSDAEGEVAAAGAKLYDARAWLEEGKHVRRDAAELLPLAERAVGA